MALRRSRQLATGLDAFSSAGTTRDALEQRMCLCLTLQCPTLLARCEGASLPDKSKREVNSVES
jgi:hypothetical protein